MRPSEVPGLNADDLASTVAQIRAALESPGWQIIRKALAAEQHATVEMCLSQPGKEDPGTYALTRADRSGYARGLRYADTVGPKILERAERALQEHQAAADAAARQEREA